MQLFESILDRTTKTGVPMHDDATQAKIARRDSLKVERAIKNTMLDKRLNYGKTHSQIFRYLTDIELFDKEKATEFIQWLTKEEKKYY